jgi:hypothetical protein
MRVILCFAAIAALCHSAQIDIPPSNTAVMVGTDVNLTCQASGDLQSEKLNWREHVTTATGALIFNSGMSGPNDEEEYGINGRYNLLIKNPQLDDGGIYSCGLEYASKPNEAFVYVFERPSLLIPDLSVGSMEQVECRVKYGGPPEALVEPDQVPRLIARMDMTTIEDGIETRTKGGLGQPFSISYVVNITASPFDHLKTFSCEVEVPEPYFKLGDRQMLHVRHKVYGIEVSPRQSTYSVGDVIVCGATGYPEPNYRWAAIESSGARPVSSGRLEVTETMIGYNKWKCDATNDDGTGMSTVEEIFEFNVVAATPPPGSAAPSIHASITALITAALYTLM